jgi:Na+-transporting NADH:ubiquinone oxidoreductase subunit C
LCGGLLALASEGLKERQQANIELERKGNILATVVELKREDNVEEIYAKLVKPFVIDYNGNVVEGRLPKDVDIAAEYKKPAKDRLLPVYEFKDEQDPSKTAYVVLPVYGYGLWNNIWGFVALKADFNSIQGAKFSHAGETPGLGARIDTYEIQSRYKDKKVFEQDNIVSITMMKGEGNDYSNDAHKVDGMSGATLTAKGLNNMLVDYLKCYENYLKKAKNK